LYAFERRLSSWDDSVWQNHPRIHFRLDDRHPFGASQHQKFVAIDDKLAFVGGLDLTLRRWDDSAHAAQNPLRSDPASQPYDPFHDVQIGFDGAAAAAVAELARERWRRLTEVDVPPVATPGSDPWPESLEPDVRDVTLALSRTEPPFGDRPAVREVEALHLAALKGARESIYLESQYFTSSSICAALSARLRRSDCPEILLVLPERCSGWIEENTMGKLRTELLQRLRAADRYGRLRALAPVLPGGVCLNVHSKLSIVDDRLVRIGSANLSNRSMGFDSECDVTLEAGDRSDVRLAIAELRTRLLAEHLGVAPKQLEHVLRECRGSLFAALDRLSGAERTLATVESPRAEAKARFLRAVPVDPRRVPSLARTLALQANQLGPLRATLATLACAVWVLALDSASPAGMAAAGVCALAALTLYQRRARRRSAWAHLMFETRGQALNEGIPQRVPKRRPELSAR
jgi:phosphatidylserine/phosphatidylglycerophosphate/cardiolipin synthase-like enzyme